MAYYNVLFDRAGDEAFEAIGLGADYVKRTNCSFFTLEAHVTYLRELHARDTVMVETQFLDYDRKRIHYVEQMRQASVFLSRFERTKVSAMVLTMRAATCGS